MLGVYDALQTALGFFGKSNTLDLGTDDGVRDVVEIDQFGVTVRADVDGAGLRQ